ncbi:MAG: Vms1/Ankzf1 family peptidyl-tRNA hydrolase [Anaerolineae bacterium]
MITRTEIEQLAAYQHSAAPLVSFYMDLDKGRLDGMQWSTRLKNLLADLEAGRSAWPDAAWESVTADAERIRAFVRDQRVVGGRGVAIFASSAANFWQTYAFPNRVGNYARVNHSAYVRPLVRMLDRYKPQCVVLVSGDQGRVFFLQGDTGETIEERGDLLSDVPRRHGQGGWSQANLQRRRSDLVHQHLKETADMTFTIFQQTPFEHLLVGGTEPVVNEFQSCLHPYLRDRLVATFSAPISASPKTVQERTRPILRALDTQQQIGLVERVEAEVRQRDMGVAGLVDTLVALRQGQVLTLILNEDFAAPGQRCLDCGAITTDVEAAACEECGGRLAPVADIVSDVVEQALEQDAEVRVIAAPAAMPRLQALGSVGALLRFAVRPTPAMAEAVP